MNLLDLERCQQTALQAAKVAAVELRAGARRRSTLAVEFKGATDLVSEVDRRAEAAIVACIRRTFPDHDILAEEGHREQHGSPWRWLIDPLDGTTNFLHGFDHYAVSVGLQYEGRLVVGVILDPVRQHLFTARRGGGAYLNGERLKVSGRATLKESLISTGLPWPDAADAEVYFRILHDVWQGCRNVRRPGAAALDLAYVAAGFLDGFFEFSLKPWDIAAGALLLEEAGGLVSDMAGGPAYLESGYVVAGSPDIHRALLGITRSHYNSN